MVGSYFIRVFKLKLFIHRLGQSIYFIISLMSMITNSYNNKLVNITVVSIVGVLVSQGVFSSSLFSVIGPCITGYKVLGTYTRFEGGSREHS